MRKKALSVFLLITMVMTLFSITPLNTVIAVDTTITLDGNNIKTTNVNGLTFKGFGEPILSN